MALRTMRVSRFGVPPALDGLLDVLRIGPRVQVRRIEADRVITRVQDIQPLGDRTLDDTVHEPVHAMLLAAKADFRVAVRQDIARIFPAAGRGHTPPVHESFHDKRESDIVRNVHTDMLRRRRQFVNTSSHVGSAPPLVGDPSKTLTSISTRCVSSMKPSDSMAFAPECSVT
jgi:hypothetical protein